MRLTCAVAVVGVARVADKAHIHSADCDHILLQLLIHLRVRVAWHDMAWHGMARHHLGGQESVGFRRFELWQTCLKYIYCREQAVAGECRSVHPTICVTGIRVFTRCAEHKRMILCD